MYEQHDHADPLGHIADMNGAMVLGVFYQCFQTYISLLECTGQVSGGPVVRTLIYIGICLVQILVYGFCIVRAVLRVRQVWRPSSIVYARKVLWLAGPAIILSTWIVQLVLYGTWPITPLAWALVLCVVLKVSTPPTAMLTIAALAQAVCIAALWNGFLDRSVKVVELFSDPNGQDWRTFQRNYRAEGRREQAEEKARKRALYRS